MPDMKNLLFILIFFSTLSVSGQTTKLIGSCGFSKDINQLKTSDTLLLSHTDLFLLKNYTFNKNGDFEICGDSKPVKAKGRTVECVWSKIGTWTYDNTMLTIYLADRSMNLFVNKINKKSGRLQVMEIINKK
jgi:hypothetical protein